MNRLAAAVMAMRFGTLVTVVFLVGAVAGADVVWALTSRPRPPPFTFAVEHGKCACTFDDDYDFAADRDRIRATICAGR